MNRVVAPVVDEVGVRLVGVVFGVVTVWLTSAPVVCEQLAIQRSTSRMPKYTVLTRSLTVPLNRFYSTVHFSFHTTVYLTNPDK